MADAEIERVRAWLLARNPEVTAIDWDEDLIDSSTSSTPSTSPSSSSCWRTWPTTSWN